jgi:4-hydroxyphenylpyruvate dioxygenase and related hemolysins
MPENYYEDLVARFDLDDGTVAQLREFDLAFDRDDTGEYLHFYTRTIGQVFWEFVERRGRYDGFGAGNAPVRLTAQGTTATADATGRRRDRTPD